MALFGGMERFGQEVWDMAVRQGRHGASEISSALFAGQSYVQYGHGPPPQSDLEQQQESPVQQGAEQTREMEGPER
jgi:hypothetical protein